MNSKQWLDLHGEQHDDRHSRILDEAYRQHQGDICPECGASWPGIVGTRLGYIVECQGCGATIEEVDLS